MQASAGNAENIRDDLNGLDKAVSAVLGLRTIERNQLLVSIAKSKFTKHRDEKNERITKPEELVRLYDLLIQVCLHSIMPIFQMISRFLLDLCAFAGGKLPFAEYNGLDRFSQLWQKQK